MARRLDRKSLLPLAVAGCALALSACGAGGGDESANEGTGTTQTTASTVTEPERQIDPEDQARADAMVLQLSDFPTGWRETPDKDQDDNAPDCFKLDQGGLTLTGRKDSDNFESGSTTTATSVGVVYENVGDAESVFGQISDGRLADCMAEYLKEQSDDEVTVEDVSVGRLSFPKVGTASDARQVVVKVKTKEPDLTVNAYVDLVAIRNERAVSFLLFSDVLTPFSPEQEAELARRVATRMAP